MTKEYSIAGAILIVGFAIAGAIYFGPMTTAPNSAVDIAQEDATAALAIISPVTDADYVRGSTNPDLTIITYDDYECPYCKLQHNNIRAVWAEISDNVRWVHRHFPLTSIHTKAVTEALAAECVGSIGGNDAFWKFTDNIFDVTPSNDGLDLAILPTLAVQAGVSTEAYETCMLTAEEAFGDKLDTHTNEAIKSGGNGTPWTILIYKDGTRDAIPGAMTDEGVAIVFGEYLNNEQ
ncbi:MAG: thioredoxin domain-containing protein [bacterium]|nr:thioredoxin domain-containing protein [bacterium]